MAIYDWGDIPTEIAAKICMHIEFYDDYETFTKVCSNWRSAVKEFSCQYINTKRTQLPWLMLFDHCDNTYRRYLYSLTKNNFLRLDLPLIERYFSSRGWLIRVTETVGKDSKTSNEYCAYVDITLFDPFSNNNVKPPLIFSNNNVNSPWLFLNNKKLPCKFIVSTSPMSKADGIDDFVVAMMFGYKHKLAFWRRGQDDTWVVPSTIGLSSDWFTDLCFFRGEIYVVDVKGNVITFGNLKDHNNKGQTRVVAKLENYPGTFTNYYITESNCDQGDISSLLVICRLFTYVYRENTKYKTISFKVFELNVDNGKAKQVKSLGNQAIFVGTNSTFTLNACASVDDEHGCKKDCIYYTDEFFTRRGHDMGIYSLTQGKIHPFYEGPPRLRDDDKPIWLEFSTV